MEEWIARAIGTLEPYYSSEECRYILHSLSMLGEDRLERSRINEEIQSRLLQEPDHKYQQKQIDSIIKVIPDVIEKLESLRLIERYGDRRSIQTKKIDDLRKEIDFIKKSVERMIVWTCYYLYHQGKYVFSAQDILQYNPKLRKDQIEKVLDKDIIPECQSKELKFNREGNDYVIDKSQKNKLIKKYMIGKMESHSRGHSQVLEEDILEMLDKSPYSNSDLAKVLDVDQSQISRKITRLREEESIIPAKFFTSGWHRYWLTNCDNCPWNFTKEECKNDSIKYLTEICKEKYGLDLDPSYFEQIEDNHTLVHLVDMFKEIPNQGSIEKEKRVFLNRLFDDIINKIGRENIEVDDHKYWIKTNKGKQPLDLPLPYLLELCL
jgi:hypothetical protein